MLQIRKVSSAEVRVPEVPAGTAIVVSQYRTRTKAVLVSPQDFARLQRLQDLLDEAGQLEPLAISALAAQLHTESEAGDELDRDALGVALGLG